MTGKQKLYAKARLKGLNQTQSAIAAGYSPATARQAASRLEKDPAVIAHMDRLSKSGQPISAPGPQSEFRADYAKPTKPKRAEAAKKPPILEKPEPDEVGEQMKNAVGSAAAEPEVQPEQKSEPKDPKNTTDMDPLEFMRELVGDLNEDPKLRLEAAKALAPYLHAKKGEMGKKEVKQQAADNVKNGRFGLRQVK